MPCIHPPELTDVQISDLLDDRPDADTRAHLKQCSHCQERFEQARQLENRLHSQLYRWNCPSADAIRDYAFDLLAINTRKQLAAHLLTCPHCRKEIYQLNDYMGKDTAVEPARPALTRTPRRPWSNVLRPQSSSGMPAFAMRGRDSSDTIMLETSGVTVFVEAQTEQDGLWLSGRLVAEDIDAWEGALVEVWQDNSLQSATSVKDSGFRCRLREVEPIDIRISPKTGLSLLIEQLKFIDEPPG